MSLHCSVPEPCIGTLEQVLELSSPPNFQKCSCPHHKPAWDRQIASYMCDQLSWTGHLSNIRTEPLVMKPLKDLLLQNLQGGIQIPTVTSVKPDLSFQNWVIPWPSTPYHITAIKFHLSQYLVDDNSLPLKAEWQGSSWQTGFQTNYRRDQENQFSTKKGYEGNEAKCVFQRAPLFKDVSWGCPGWDDGSV